MIAAAQVMSRASSGGSCVVPALMVPTVMPLILEAA